MQNTDVKAIKEETAKHLGKDVDLSYVTEELIAEYRTRAKAVETHPKSLPKLTTPHR